MKQLKNTKLAHAYKMLQKETDGHSVSLWTAEIARIKMEHQLNNVLIVDFKNRKRVA